MTRKKACARREIVVGQKFGRLTVVSKAPNILGGITVKRAWGAWNCKCDCGNTITVKTVHLNERATQSCGCIVANGSTTLVPGQKFGRLTLISYKDSKWFCLCECGESIETSSSSLVCRNTKSCGCLKIDVSKSKAKVDKLVAGRRKFEPTMASARRVCKQYRYRDKNFTLTFDEFLALSQQNCFYCGIGPSTSYNYFGPSSSRSSEMAKTTGTFVYNGLDRIDSSKSHTIDNVVACCYICNRAKSDKTLDEFYKYLTGLRVQPFIPPTELLPLDHKILLSAAKKTSHQYQELNIDQQTFYTYSQLPCVYCGREKTNHCDLYINKKMTKEEIEMTHFGYNGIDKIDPSKLHTIDNIVPCCWSCNFAKNDMPLSEFHDWIYRITAYQKERAALDNEVMCG